MKWEVRKVEKGWAIYLIQKYCKTKEPVCYGVSKTEVGANEAVRRLNEEENSV